ncbi:hypothetical protein Pcinc_030974 [Petrolisthes cinctipes]|uniref:Uncharacterized protein n=1 Tax=Petrolisthes cinctipes TaxID=88211 RepID=A0AAE1EXK9_PETCI|nr:hypothetical protein Pcinc_030974 [Petrolisthes cinctipes]
MLERRQQRFDPTLGEHKLEARGALCVCALYTSLPACLPPCLTPCLLLHDHQTLALPCCPSCLTSHYTSLHYTTTPDHTQHPSSCLHITPFSPHSSSSPCCPSCLTSHHTTPHYTSHHTCCSYHTPHLVSTLHLSHLTPHLPHLNSHSLVNTSLTAPHPS